MTRTRLSACATRLRSCATWLGDESGQAMAEYSITTFYLLGIGALVAMSQVVPFFAEGLQGYIDFYFYCLNLPLG